MAASVDEKAKPTVAAEVCAACGAEFECGAKAQCGSESASCWCFGIELNEAARTELSSRYQSCLCRQCLTKWADGRGE
jgi:Cysteine-rich CWC